MCLTGRPAETYCQTVETRTMEHDCSQTPNQRKKEHHHPVAKCPIFVVYCRPSRFFWLLPEASLGSPKTLGREPNEDSQGLWSLRAQATSSPARCWATADEGANPGPERLAGDAESFEFFFQGLGRLMKWLSSPGLPFCKETASAFCK